MKCIWLFINMKIKAMRSLFILFIFLLSQKTFVQGQMITRAESVQSLYVELFRDNKFLGRATGFVIRPKDQSYLITNWHVVTNKNPVDGSWLDTKNSISPNKIGILHNAKTLGKYAVKQEKLLDEKGNKLFKEFRVNGEMVDVVALPLKDTLGDITLYPVNFRNTYDSLRLEPTDRLFVLGFPKGIKSTPFLPIWKSGLIASEPEIDQENKPIIWIDLASFGGMSGSPVYLITSELNYKNGNSSKLFGKVSFFMGVFSHGQDIDIGALWKSIFLKKKFELLP